MLFFPQITIHKNLFFYERLFFLKDIIRYDKYIFIFSERCLLVLTAEQAATKSNISIPASANATEAHVIAAAKQDVVPSFSNTFINISIVDFGNNSSRTDG